MSEDIVGTNAVGGSDVIPAPSNTEAPAPAKESVQSNEPVSDDTEQSGDLDSTLLDIWKKNNPDEEASPRERDEQGRFKGKDNQPTDQKPTDQPTDDQLTDEQKAAKEAEEQQKAQDGTETGQPQPPESWSKEAKAEWAKVPPGLQKYVAERETQAHTMISQQGAVIAKFRPVGEVINQNIDLFRQENVPVDVGISQLLAAQRALQQRPVEAIRHIMNLYGVDPLMLIDAKALANQGAAQPAAAPEVAALKQEIEDLRRQLGETAGVIQSREQADMESQRGLLVNEINKFAHDNPLLEQLDFDEFKQMFDLLRTRVSNGEAPPMTFRDMFQTVYDKLVWANPKTREAIMAEQRKKDETERQARQQEEARKTQQAKNLKQTAARPQTANARTKTSMDDTLEAEARRLYGQG